jgi:hypothetical protein
MHLPASSSMYVSPGMFLYSELPTAVPARQLGRSCLTARIMQN